MQNKIEQPSIETVLNMQRLFFASNTTKDIKYRILQLKNLKKAILKYEKEIADALWQDLRKSYQEAYLTEISIVLGELDFHIKKLKQWAKPHRVYTPIQLLPSRSRIYYEPLGVSLIIAPWNYPFHLLFAPLIGAISSGCTAMLKSSPYTPNTSSVMEKIVKETFESHYIAYFNGGREVNQMLLAQRYDLIFFTGSPTLGKIVMKYAAEHLTPMVLELGGKSPCIVDEDADIMVAAKRIAWGKLINAGQTCIAPDYIFVNNRVKSKLLEELPKAITAFYGEDPQQSEFYPRIVNVQNVVRLQTLMQHGKIVFGGKIDSNDKYIAPTIIDEVQPDFPIMQDEIFGPLFPILTFDKVDEALDYVNAHEKPLAFYYFGKSSKTKEILSKSTSGGACINDTLMHIANHHMPFGGVGNSGMSQYHGFDSFKAFSNARSVIITPTWMDLPVKYVPFRYFNWVKKIL